MKTVLPNPSNETDILLYLCLELGFKAIDPNTE